MLTLHITTLVVEVNSLLLVLARDASRSAKLHRLTVPI